MVRPAIVTGARERVLPDPAFLHGLLADTRFSPLWLILRVTLGWILLEAGWLRLQGAAGPLAIALTLAGIALILGITTGLSAFIGGCLSAGIWAGEDLTVAALRFAAVVWLVLAWKTAGWIGIDRWLLPLLGMPWRGGHLFGARENSGASVALGGDHGQESDVRHDA
jgi:thiosulfate dehydrogenase [quinone] large subunit